MHEEDFESYVVVGWVPVAVCVVWILEASSRIPQHKGGEQTGGVSKWGCLVGK